MNLVPGEPLALAQELANFDNSIQLDILLGSVFDPFVHDLISRGLFHVVWVELYWCQLFCNVRCAQQWWKVWLKAVHIDHWVHIKDQGNAELEIIVSHNLGDGVGSA